MAASVFQMPMAENVISEQLKEASSEMLYLWNHHKVTREVQAKLTALGFGDAEVFFLKLPTPQPTYARW